ncbi:MAG: hypothetical protein MST10_08325, partial [Lentisphaeria bacterium]|nr:hypothetical protein [Lentisphaeria bacterium]
YGDESSFYTGKPKVDGLGYTFNYRNYRADQGKWQTADPLGYPDGFNNYSYVNNGVTDKIDYLGFEEHYMIVGNPVSYYDQSIPFQDYYMVLTVTINHLRNDKTKANANFNVVLRKEETNIWGSVTGYSNLTSFACGTAVIEIDKDSADITSFTYTPSSNTEPTSGRYSVGAVSRLAENSVEVFMFAAVAETTINWKDFDINISGGGSSPGNLNFSVAIKGGMSFPVGYQEATHGFTFVPQIIKE